MKEVKLTKQGAKALYDALGAANDAIIKNGSKKKPTKTPKK